MGTNRYQEMKDRQMAKFNKFPIKFAFSDEQFERGMRELGLEPSETDKVYSLPGTGGFYRRTDADELNKMWADFEREMEMEIAADTTGDGFIYDMFYYELCNHEYGYTGDDEDAINALDLSYEEIEADERLKKALCKAQRAIMQECDAIW